MNKRNVICYTFLSVFFCTINGFSQGNIEQFQLQFENFYGAKNRTAKSMDVEGSEFLFDEWFPVDLTFTKGTVQFEKAKLNLFVSKLEVVYKDREMNVSSEAIEIIRFLGSNKWFIPAGKREVDGVTLEGFLEIFDPEMETPYLMTQHYIFIQKPNSNGYINGGTLTSKLVKAQKNYIYDGSNMVQIKKKKNLIDFYQNRNIIIPKSELKKLDIKDPKSIHMLVTALKSQK